MPGTTEIQDEDHYLNLLEARLEAMVKDYQQEEVSESWESLIRRYCDTVAMTDIYIPTQPATDIIRAVIDSPLVAEKISEAVRFPQPIPTNPTEKKEAMEAAQSMTLSEWLGRLTLHR